MLAAVLASYFYLYTQTILYVLNCIDWVLL